MASEVVHCQVAVHVNHVVITKQQNTETVKNNKQTTIHEFFFVITWKVSWYWPLFPVNFDMNCNDISQKSGSSLGRNWKTYWTAKQLREFKKKNCQKVFQKPRMRWISVELPPREQTRPCMLACFESPTQKHKHSTDSKQQKSNIFSLAFLASCTVGR